MWHLAVTICGGVKIYKSEDLLDLLRNHMRMQYGERINLKYVQKILHFSSADAVLLAVQGGLLPLPIRSTGQIGTDLLAKYIVDQYVMADSTDGALLGKNKPSR